jgi:valyl-tRNA synthetase
MLNKVYDFREVESYCLSKSSFVARGVSFKKPPFSIVIPPPNVTGSLHMGHALNSTIQDFLIRFKLLKGYDAVWFIGTDHAGIATQNVVEKKLLKEGIKRKDLSKEQFLQKIFEWKEEYGNIILEQFKRLGLYIDIDRARFTMDEFYSKAVKRAFIELYNKGYVYKGKRVVNWCPRCLTSLSDLEVVYKNSKTKLYYVRYYLLDSKEYLVIATTRPETILADTAVAVSPNDQRYQKYIGKKVKVPIIEREVLVITSEKVDPFFGTGALKVTPAHDFNDYKIYQENKNVHIVNIFDTYARINIDFLDEKEREKVKDYHLLERYQAREKIVKQLEDLELLEKVEDYETNIGHCYRCDTVIEPYYSDQWFIRMRELVEEPKRRIENDEIKFYPPTFKKVILNWYDNIEDWCVSRQIIWGHRIPIFTCKVCGNVEASDYLDSCPKCGGEVIQEEDVLDTWFSSSLWPFAVMYWPDPSFEKYKQYYYPTDVLTTAREIIFLWVSRMIVMSLFFLNEIPFKNVIIHAVILAPSGKRMSKSLGTGIDPLELIDKYGADAVRMGLIFQTAESQDVKFSFEKIEMARNFLNKLWNSIRYFQLSKQNNPSINSLIKNSEIINKWILFKLGSLVERLEQYTSEYRFFDYCMDIYHFVWNIFCDWYIEFSKLFEKNEDYYQVFIEVFKTILLYLHPIAPFFTFYVYEKLFNQDITNQRIELSKNYKDFYKESILIDDLIDSIKMVRPYVNELTNISKKKVSIKFMDTVDKDFVNMFLNFTNCVEEDKEERYFILKTKISNIKIFLDEEYVEKYREFFSKKLNELINNYNKLDKLLSNRDFLEKASVEVVNQYKENLEKYKQMIEVNRNIQEILR